MNFSRNLYLTSPMMNGSDVKEVQSKLNTIGFNCGTADGYFGQATKNAVINFQRHYGLEVDGVVGKTTWNKLFSILSIYSLGAIPSPDTTNKYMIQGICYIPSTSEILCAYRLTNSSASNSIGTCKLVKYKTNGSSITKQQVYTSTLYHCNDMTYNASTNEVLAVTIHPTTSQNEISIINYSDMKIKSTKLFEGNYLAGIARDEANNHFILVGSHTNANQLYVYIADENLNVISKFAISREGSLSFQSIEYYNNKIFVHFNSRISVYSMSGSLIDKLDYNYIDNQKEGEGICHITGNMFTLALVNNSNDVSCSQSSKLYKFTTPL